MFLFFLFNLPCQMFVLQSENDDDDRSSTRPFRYLRTTSSFMYLMSDFSTRHIRSRYFILFDFFFVISLPFCIQFPHELCSPAKQKKVSTSRILQLINDLHEKNEKFMAQEKKCVRSMSYRWVTIYRSRASELWAAYNCNKLAIIVRWRSLVDSQWFTVWLRSF